MGKHTFKIGDVGGVAAYAVVKEHELVYSIDEAEKKAAQLSAEAVNGRAVICAAVIVAKTTTTLMTAKEADLKQEDDFS